MDDHEPFDGVGFCHLSFLPTREADPYLDYSSFRCYCSSNSSCDDTICVPRTRQEKVEEVKVAVWEAVAAEEENKDAAGELVPALEMNQFETTMDAVVDVDQ